MKIRLHEIEVGVVDPDKTAHFYKEILGLDWAVNQPQLKVFHANSKSMDLNFSTHFAPKEICISFITDELETVTNKLSSLQISYQGPLNSHLGMTCIVFKDPEGNTVKVNSPTDKSPEWLTT